TQVVFAVCPQRLVFGVVQRIVLCSLTFGGGGYHPRPTTGSQTFYRLHRWLPTNARKTRRSPWVAVIVIVVYREQVYRTGREFGVAVAYRHTIYGLVGGGFTFVVVRLGIDQIFNSFAVGSRWSMSGIESGIYYTVHDIIFGK